MIANCMLYDLKTKKLLADKILNTSYDYLKKIVKNPDLFYKEEWKDTKKIGKDGKPKKRLTQVPCPKSKGFHKKIKKELNKIGVSPYLMSTKGKGHVKNASEHMNSDFCLTMDIEGFFPNSLSIYVTKFFRKHLNMPRDVAEFLTRLVTYKGHIPTGSPISSILAYLMHRDVFDAIYEIAKEYGIKFTLYVDDLTFSSDKPIPLALRARVEKLVSQHQLNLKRSKQRSFGKDKARVITGVAIIEKNIKSPYKLKQKLFKGSFKKLKTSGIDSLSEQELNKMFGTLCSIRSIEGNVYPTLYKTLLEKKHSIKK